MCHVPDQIFEDPFFVGLKAFLNMKIDTQPTNTLYYKILPSFFGFSEFIFWEHPSKAYTQLTEPGRNSLEGARNRIFKNHP